MHLTWNGKKSAIFNHNGWFGGASTAAEGKVGEHIQKMEALDRQIDSAIDFYDDAHKAIYDAKKKIVADTETAQQEINEQEESIELGDSIAHGDRDREDRQYYAAEQLRRPSATAAATLDSKFPRPEPVTKTRSTVATSSHHDPNAPSPGQPRPRAPNSRDSS